MKTSIYLTVKYWKKHKKNALALIFSGMLTTAMIVLTLLGTRESFNRDLNHIYDSVSMAQLQMAYYCEDEEVFDLVTQDLSGYTRCTLSVLGTMGNPYLKLWYGVIDGDADLLHIPMESGRLPEAANEAAIERRALDTLHWVGKLGEEITLNDRTYTVVGIIDEFYGDHRAASPYESAYPLVYIQLQRMEDHLRVPVIFIGESDEEPIYKIDYLGDIYDPANTDPDEIREQYRFLDDAFSSYTVPKYGDKWMEWSIWFIGPENTSQMLYNLKTDWYDPDLDGGNTYAADFFLIMSGIGAVIASLSVFSVLRSIFTERRSRIEILKRIGMSRRRIIGMYAWECAAFTVVQTIAGFIAGSVVYLITYLFKGFVLNYEWYGGFTSDTNVLYSTRDPFLFAGIFSAIIMVLAYIITCLTTKEKQGTPKKERKPRSLSRCFGRIFRQSGVTVIQTVSLVLICTGTVLGYMYYTDNGKTLQESVWTITGDSYMPPSFKAYHFDMEDYGISEYYSSAFPDFYGIESYGNMENMFYIAPYEYTAGIDDSIADLFPESAIATGYIQNPFIICEQPMNRYAYKIEFYEQAEKDLILEYSTEEYQNFFDEGQLGAKNLYQAKTKLARGATIHTLSEYVIDGEINIEKLNSGEEILLVTESAKPPFMAGEILNMGFASSEKNAHSGISDIALAEVRVGAIIRIPPESAKSDLNDIVRYAVRTDEAADNGSIIPYNFLTTSAGASAMGMQAAKYNEIYSFEPISGGVIPLEAEMSMKSLEILKRENFIQKASQYSMVILLLIVMSVLGFSAYFNGIGMKIRLKAYDISVLRAMGTPIERIRRKLLLDGLKIPLIASAIAYVILKILQVLANYGLQLSENALPMGVMLDESDFQHQKEIIDAFFLYRNWWQVDAELPVLVLFIVISMVTILLTSTALKKFRANIAENLSEGRTRQ